jgi:hypothetical protein
MGTRKWKAGQGEQPEELSFLRRFRKPIAIAAILAAATAFFIYRFNNSKFQYGDPHSEYDRAIAECLRDHTRVDSAGGAADDAADTCVRDIPPPAGAQKH